MRAKTNCTSNSTLNMPKALLAFTLSLLLSLFAFQPEAFATLQADQRSLTDEEIQTARESGAANTNFEEDSQLQSGDVAALSADNAALSASDAAETATLASAAAASTPSSVSSSVKVYSYSGADMYETAAMEAMQAYPEGSSRAILAGSGDAWVDSLAATGLAASVGPILYSQLDSLPQATLDALKQLGVSSVIIVGGTACISQSVIDALKSNGISLEARLAGSDAIETQLAIYDYGQEKGYWSGDYVFVATSTWHSDALSLAPIAYSKRVPIFLVGGSGGFSETQKEVLLEQAHKGCFANAVIAGGTAVVPKTTQGFLEGVTFIAYENSASSQGTGAKEWSSENVQRAAGDDSYGTSRQVAKWAVENMGFSWESPSISIGQVPYDALAGAVLAGNLKSPILLAENNNTYTLEEMKSNKDSVKNIHFLGGEACISMRSRMTIADDMGFPWAAIPDYKVYVDAGHGWNDSNNGVWDSGATGCGYNEADLTKELADRVNDILRYDYGISTFLNDDGGWYKLRHQEAIDQGCDSLVSIHFNATGTGTATGTESLIHNYNASYLSWSWQNSIHPKLIEGTSLRDRGMKTQEVAILGGYLPATLLEICFIDNASDMQVYQNRKEEIAQKIAQGIVAR